VLNDRLADDVRRLMLNREQTEIMFTNLHGWQHPWTSFSFYSHTRAGSSFPHFRDTGFGRLCWDRTDLPDVFD